MQEGVAAQSTNAYLGAMADLFADACRLPRPQPSHVRTRHWPIGFARARSTRSSARST
jgi:hypothetical protein